MSAALLRDSVNAAFDLHANALHSLTRLCLQPNTAMLECKLFLALSLDRQAVQISAVLQICFCIDTWQTS